MAGVFCFLAWFIFLTLRWLNNQYFLGWVSTMKKQKRECPVQNSYQGCTCLISKKMFTIQILKRLQWQNNKQQTSANSMHSVYCTISAYLLYICIYGYMHKHVWLSPFSRPMPLLIDEYVESTEGDLEAQGPSSGSTDFARQPRLDTRDKSQQNYRQAFDW